MRAFLGMFGALVACTHVSDGTGVVTPQQSAAVEYEQPQSTASVGVSLDNLIEVAVRISPDRLTPRWKQDPQHAAAKLLRDLVIAYWELANTTYQAELLVDDAQRSAEERLQQQSAALTARAGLADDALLQPADQLDIAAGDVSQATTSEGQSQLHAVAVARERVDLADKAICVAQDNLRTQRAVGHSREELMQEQASLTEVRLARARAVADYHEAVARLEFLDGALLAHYNINVLQR
jgi:hypothetical protein